MSHRVDLEEETCSMKGAGEPALGPHPSAAFNTVADGALLWASVSPSAES